MPTILRLVTYALLGLGFLVVATNGWSLLSGLPSVQPEDAVSVLVGALLMGAGFLARKGDAAHWARYRESAFEFAAAHKWWLIVASVVSFGGSVLMGLPGGALSSILDGVVNLFADPLGWGAPHGDTQWPLALGYTFLGPWACFGIYLGIGRLTGRRPSAASVLFFSALAFVAFHTLFRFLNRLG
jgi:hypothetical protein